MSRFPIGQRVDNFAEGGEADIDFLGLVKNFAFGSSFVYLLTSG
jgi:hypothetical protein